MYIFTFGVNVGIWFGGVNGVWPIEECIKPGVNPG